MRLLLPIDESDCSLKTLEWSIHTFDKVNTDFSLLYVVPMPSGYIPAVPEFVPVIADSEVLQSQSELAIKTLALAKTVLENHECKLDKAEFITGDPVSEICKYADSWNIDQVVIGSHGKTGFQKFMLGSVSSDVMKYCKKPVIIYRNLQPVEDLVFN